MMVSTMSIAINGKSGWITKITPETANATALPRKKYFIA
jgi:hypothetical protein